MDAPPGLNLSDGFDACRKFIFVKFNAVGFVGKLSRC